MNRFFDIRSISSRELLPGELRLRGMPVDHPLFELAGVLRFRSDIAGGVIFLEEGFCSDLASIPEFVQGWFMENDDPRISAGAWVHDLLCDTKGHVTLECGKAVFLDHTHAARILAFEAMPELGATKFQQWCVFQAVNLFGPKF